MKTIQYINFTPPEMTEELGELEFQDVFEKSPSDSYVAASAEKVGENRFRAVLECRASDVGFFVEAVASNSFDCLQKVFEQAKDRLADWRSHRFEGTFDHLSLAS